ncbi:MAG: ORF6N domain-containing protein [Chitinophagaceae bacterium]|nr:ORF6N domain-containing protein [Chitinophagaceae bacterium]
MKMISAIENKIYELRSVRVMLDYDLADLYEVPTKALNQAVKRNIKRFPDDFMFRLSIEEWNLMRSQIVTASQTKRNTGVTPFAFTEQGVAMLSGILNSDKAINMNIAIMRAFVAIKRATILHMDIHEQLKEIKQRISEHDSQLSGIYDAIENLLDEKAEQKTWENRKRIGFKP